MLIFFIFFFFFFQAEDGIRDLTVTGVQTCALPISARIAADPADGQIVCHCERVTRGEIRDALASLVPPADLGGLRRRTRAMNGRCQGFYCAAAVSRLLAEGRARAGA